jgi:hypothetical protein
VQRKMIVLYLKSQGMPHQDIKSWSESAKTPCLGTFDPTNLYLKRHRGKAISGG